MPPIFGPPTGGPGEPPPAYQGAGYPGAGYQGPGYQTAAPSTLLNATEAVQYGWRALMNNIGPLVLITLVVLAVDVVTGLISRQTDNTFLAFFMQIVTWLVTSVVAFGLVRAALAIVDGRAPVVADLFNTDRIVPYLLASIMFSIAVTLGLILCVIPGLVVGFLLWFFAYAILDSPPGPNSPASSPVAALRRSYELTSAHAGELLMLALICLVLNIVGALFCGLGLLVSLPVTAIATAWAWRRMTGGTIAPQAQ